LDFKNGRRAIVSDLNKSDADSVCGELSRAFQGVLSWKWDDRFETVLAEFGVESKDKVRAILERYLSSTWDRSNVGTAPEIVRTIDRDFGGLWPEQWLFTSDPNQDALIFCAWWPWENGKSISIRIGPFYQKLSESEIDQKVDLFKKSFGV
jgi:hypothetical protein